MKTQAIKCAPKFNFKMTPTNLNWAKNKKDYLPYIKTRYGAIVESVALECLNNKKKNKHQIATIESSILSSAIVKSQIAALHNSESNWPNTKPKIILSNFSKITSDQKRRSLFFKDELENLVIKGLLSSVFLPKYKKHKRSIPHSEEQVTIRFSRLIFEPGINRKMARKVATITRLRNRCVLSAHPSTIGKLGLSRITFRKLAGFGKLPGLNKI